LVSDQDGHGHAEKGKQSKKGAKRKNKEEAHDTSCGRKSEPKKCGGLTPIDHRGDDPSQSAVLTAHRPRQTKEGSIAQIKQGSSRCAKPQETAVKRAKPRDSVKGHLKRGHRGPSNATLDLPHSRHRNDLITDEKREPIRAKWQKGRRGTTAKCRPNKTGRAATTKDTSQRVEAGKRNSSGHKRREKRREGGNGIAQVSQGRVQTHRGKYADFCPSGWGKGAIFTNQEKKKKVWRRVWGTS